MMMETRATKRKLKNEKLKWLQKHRQSADHKTRTFKSITISALYFTFAILVGAIAIASSLFISLFGTLFILFAFVFAIAITLNKHENEAYVGISVGLVAGVVIALINLAPML